MKRTKVKSTILIILVLTLMPVIGWSQQMPGVQREDPSYTATGKLVLFVLSPKDKKLRLYMAGKQTGEVSMSENPRLVSVRLSGQQGKKDLEFHKVGNSYEVSGLPKTGKYDLDLNATVLEQTDSVRMKLEVP